jgi:hypothetical protein
VAYGYAAVKTWQDFYISSENAQGIFNTAMPTRMVEMAEMGVAEMG